MSGVSLQKLCKEFGGARVVDSVDLEIRDGELVVLVGPSGCGKTTTLRMVAGLEEASSGRVLIGGRDVTQVHPKDRNVAMVFQSYALYPHKTVAENLGFALKLARVDRREIDRRVREVARTLGLEEVLHRRPRTLSGGQRQRVAVGRAIVRNPAVFLFDEPLSNLDAKLRVVMRSELIRLHHDLAATMIHVTHDQVEAMTMGDRIVVMDRGIVQQVGSPLQVYDDPANVFVAGFIGSPGMNLLDVEVAASGDATVVRAGELSLALDASHPAAGARRVTLGIRPEFLSLTPSSGQIAIPARIDAVEHLGSDTILEIAASGLRLTAKSQRREDVRTGQTVSFGVLPGQILAFEPASGRRLYGAGRSTAMV